MTVAGGLAKWGLLEGGGGGGVLLLAGSVIDSKLRTGGIFNQLKCWVVKRRAGAGNCVCYVYFWGGVIRWWVGRKRYKGTYRGTSISYLIMLSIR